MFCSGSLSVLKEELGHAGSPTFKTVVERVKGVVQDAMANADIPFYQVVDAANVARSSAYTPIFQTLFTLANADGEAAKTDEESQMGDLATEELSVCSSARDFLQHVCYMLIIGTMHIATYHPRGALLKRGSIYVECASFSDSGDDQHGANGPHGAHK